MLDKVSHIITGTRVKTQQSQSNILYHHQRFLFRDPLHHPALHTMLPPLEEAVLKNNPDFAALYSTLSTAILNPDGTTKDDKSHVARERGAVREVHSSQPRLSSIVCADVD